jgi:endoglucanase
VVFELLNEPNVEAISDKKDPKPADLEHWREIEIKLVNVIHQADPDRYVIVSSGGWSDPAGLIQMGNLRLPNVVYTFHCYEPMLFTHQGATWTGKALAKIKGVPYPLSAADVKKLKDEAKPSEGDEWPFSQYPNGFGKKEMRQFVQPVIDFGKKEGLILYCGEFGVHKPFAPPAARAQWIKDYVTLLDKNKIAWAMWAYHSGFDLAEKDGKADPKIVKALGLK